MRKRNTFGTSFALGLYQLIQPKITVGINIQSVNPNVHINIDLRKRIEYHKDPIKQAYLSGIANDQYQRTHKKRRQLYHNFD
jgi:hypothetical protein|tara:strand:+ start:800 stop:1045 length:246 start_codon:yes stop_codon:yes gene_type:complete